MPPLHEAKVGPALPVKRILYIHEEPPADGLGCEIVVKRHLLRLQDSGWEAAAVHSAAFGKNVTFPAGWRRVALPGRRSWWPPAGRPLSPLHNLRLNLLRRAVETGLKDWRPDIVLTQLYRRYPLLAAHCAARWKAPLGVFAFDQREVWEEDELERAQLTRESRHILRSADRVWAVSEEMRAHYAELAGPGSEAKFTVLPPLPQGISASPAEWKPNFGTRPVMAYAGSLHEFHLPAMRLTAKALAAVNGELLLVSREDNPALNTLRREFGNVRFQPFLPQEELVPFLAANASALLVAYSFDLEAQPWARLSFPSKLIEFVHTGLPVLLIAPLGTALQNWANKVLWKGSIESSSPEATRALVERASTRQGWSEMAEQSRRTAGGAFNPVAVHERFHDDLLAMTRF